MKRVLPFVALCFLLIVGSAASMFPAAANAARCSADANGNWSCTHQKRYNYYFCNGVYLPRAVRWQVPQGTPPAGGWPVAFHFAGTQPTDFSHAFARNVRPVSSTSGTSGCWDRSDHSKRSAPSISRNSRTLPGFLVAMRSFTMVLLTRGTRGGAAALHEVSDRER